MKNLVVYEHISGIPAHMDTINEEITESTRNYCNTEKQAEKYINEINNISPTDRNGRKRHFYIYWM